MDRDRACAVARDMLVEHLAKEGTKVERLQLTITKHADGNVTMSSEPGQVDIADLCTLLGGALRTVLANVPAGSPRDTMRELLVDGLRKEG